MLNKEEIENNTIKVSIPLISDEDIRIIDNNFESAINEFNKQLVHNKDLAIAQYIITKQQRQIEQLETEKQKVIDKLEERRKKNNKKYGLSIEDDDFPEMYEYGAIVEEDDYILSILKGEQK